MSIYNDLTEDQQHSPRQAGHKVQRYFSGTTPSVGLGYPDLYLELFLKTDSKTKLINPANVWRGDVKILVAPFGVGLSEAFHAPTIGVHKEVHGAVLTFGFHYTVSLLGTAKVHVGFKDFFSIEKDVAPSTGLVFVGGSVNTVTGDAQFTSRKAGTRERLQEE